MNIDLSVWGTIALMHFVAVVSPGPDFAVVLKQGLQKSLKAALWTSVGIATGILLHVCYSILGISLLIKTTPWFYRTLLYIAAAYFVYIGVSALRSRAPNNISNALPSENIKQSAYSWYGAFTLGFLTNGLNPKATLFFLALFTVAIPAHTDLSMKIFYGLYLSIATGLWFCIISYIINIKCIRQGYDAYGYWFDRIMGAVLIIMALILILSQ